MPIQFAICLPMVAAIVLIQKHYAYNDTLFTSHLNEFNQDALIDQRVTANAERSSTEDQNSSEERRSTRSTIEAVEQAQYFRT